MAQRLRDCAEAISRLIDTNGRHIDITAPWAGDHHPLGIRAAEGESATQVAARIHADPAFRRAGDPVDSIVLLSGTGIGADLARQLGDTVRVYEPSTALDDLAAGTPVTVTGGGHWVIHGELTRTQHLAVTLELARALRADFRYAASAPRADGAPVRVDDRAATVTLLGNAWNDRADGILDLVEASRILSYSERPGLLWGALMELLRDRITTVHTVVDMHRDGDRWRVAEVPP
ncbi:hypothetical protein AB0J83_17465 [Actinoplanes sp. NPDC049596]|uniref:hypothetical protein n=1 Tax=unclassified Actinoplanes TaxID=2626549 RepID=UPI003429B930